MNHFTVLHFYQTRGSFFQIPSGKAVGRFIVSNCDRDIESQNLKDMIPEWVRELVVEVRSSITSSNCSFRFQFWLLFCLFQGVSPKFHKLAFFLLPHPNFNSKIHNNKKLVSICLFRSNARKIALMFRRYHRV